MNEIEPIEYWLNKIHCGDAYELLKQIPSESVDVVITSPPYYGLRTYGKYTERIFDGDPNCSHEWNEYIKPKERGSYGESSWVRPSRNADTKWNKQISHFCVKCNAYKGELGLEPSWELYVRHLVDLFREVKRILKKTGSFWLNIGDTYASKSMNWTEEYANKPQWHPREPILRGISGYKPKCLMLIPFRVAFALIDDGWILRNVIIWKKLNAIPSSVRDRLAQTYEYVLHFVKSRKYYYCLDNIRIPHKTKFAPFNLRVRDVKRGKGGISAFGPLKASEKEVENYVYPEKSNLTYDSKYTKHDLAVGRVGNFSYTDPLHTKVYNSLGKNPGDVWEVNNLTIPNSKFLNADIKTASPSARTIRTLLSGKLTTHVKKKILDVGAYLKTKLKESGLNVKQLSEITGIKETTLAHYFRTDFSGQALPDRETWNLLKPILNLGNYDDYISEEIRSALPQTHPLGRNPGDVWEMNTRPLKEMHFATFPPELPLRPILATCPPDNGIVLDPLAGSGTVALTCELINHGKWDEFRLYVNEIAKKQKWNIKWIMIEMNPEYCKIAEKRLAPFSHKTLEEYAEN